MSLAQQTRDVDPVLGECWADVEDGGPTFTQHWVNVSCILGWTRTDPPPQTPPPPPPGWGGDPLSPVITRWYCLTTNHCDRNSLSWKTHPSIRDVDWALFYCWASVSALSQRPTTVSRTAHQVSTQSVEPDGTLQQLRQFATVLITNWPNNWFWPSHGPVMFRARSIYSTDQFTLWFIMRFWQIAFPQLP